MSQEDVKKHLEHWVDGLVAQLLALKPYISDRAKNNIKISLFPELVQRRISGGVKLPTHPHITSPANPEPSSPTAPFPSKVLVFPINDTNIEMIKYFETGEGIKKYLKAYKDAVGVWTIGYGHTGIKHKDGTVKKGRIITEEEADKLLSFDLQKFAEGVRRCVKVDINEDQFAALVSFSFNVGLGNLRKSTLLKRLNAGRFSEVPPEFLKWRYAGGKQLLGLYRRRVAESLLFKGENWRDGIKVKKLP